MTARQDRGGAGAELDVLLGGTPIGVIASRGPGRYRFAYADDAAAVEGDPAGAPRLSVSLPRRAQPFAPAQSRPFFEGLLPEGALRATFARNLGVSEDNGFALLAALGAECAGAVVVVPRGARAGLPGEGDSARVAWLDGTELAQKLADLPRHPLGVEPGGMRASLGGVQHKLLLTRSPSGRLGIPLDGSPTTHILKPGHEQYPDIVANEAFCLRVAACLGLGTARADVIEVGGRPCLLVERFDRVRVGDRIVRVHQEDACQALGVLPAAKYEIEGGPSLPALVELIRDVSDRAAADVNALVRALLVNVLLGNCDAHGKNWALLHDGDGSRLAPLYDIVSTTAYPELTTALAMRVGGAAAPDEVDASAWSRLAVEAGLGAALTRVLARDLPRVLSCVATARAAARAEGWHRPVIDAIAAAAHERAGRVLA